MWAKLEVVPSEKDIVYLPTELTTKVRNPVTINFGCLSSSAEVRPSNNLRFINKSSIEQPITIMLSSHLVRKLLLPEMLTYRLKTQGNQLIIGPVIGFLTGAKEERFTPLYMQKYSDRMGIYSKVGGLIFAFSQNTANLNEHTAKGFFYNPATCSWEYGNFPLPDAIYRRDFHSNPKFIKKLISLTKRRLFNSHRYSKLDLYYIVKRDLKLSKHLPPTEPSRDLSQAKRFINTYGKVIFKPVDLSRGRGICIIEKSGNGYVVTDYRSKPSRILTFQNDAALDEFFASNRGLFCKYIIQKYLSLASVDDSLFDIRVVMQKGTEKNWECTGIECRVSHQGSHLTNISRGGYALSLDDALRSAFPGGADYRQLAKKIHEFCMEFCICMDRTGEHFAELGMDVALDVNKNLWLIEANVYPSFKGFKKMDYETYLAIRNKPLLYALALTDFRGTEE